ncbi:MAG: 50S ribosomal protein L29 [Acholeplasmatales bacterium]|nr:50S ribosomal protein L29 [Acholeplasmatales bacterium]
MKKTEVNKSIRKMSVEEINAKIAELKEELFNLKFQAALGNLENPARMNEIKKNIARMKTVITEKETASKASN